MEKVTQQTITNAADALTELPDLRMNELARLVCTQYSGDNLVVTPDGDDLEFDIQIGDSEYEGGIVYLNRDNVTELYKVLGDWLTRQNGESNGTEN